MLLLILPDLVAPLRDYKVIVYGVIFILVSLYLPRGIAGTFEAWQRGGGRRDSAGANAADGSAAKTAAKNKLTRRPFIA